jgi:triosephosphate isomerase
MPLVAGNWKMNKTVPESLTLVADLLAGMPRLDHVEVAVLPPFTSLWPVSNALEGSEVGLGAQNMYWEEKGAYTGEISPLMVAGWCRYALLGHSERRQLFGETDEKVNRKVRAALGHGLRPLVAVGETLEEHEAGSTEAVLGRQVPAALAGLSEEQGLELVLAYEPIWAIGTGNAATTIDAEDACVFIRSLVGKLGGDEAAAGVRIQYGGSVNGENAADLMAEPDVDGLLVGGASLDAAKFTDVIRASAACYRS